MNKKALIGCYNRTVILTYIGIVIAFLGLVNIKNIKVALICLALAGICDLFDGPIARLSKNRTYTEKEFGKQVDSLADIIISVILPSYILYENYQISITIIVCAVYILAGVIRLAWFNIIKSDNCYIGLPVTYITLIMPVIYTILNVININDIIQTLIINIIYLIVAMLFIVNVKIPKPSGIWYIIFVGIAIVIIPSIILI